MRETMQLLQALDELAARQQEAVLATVVKVEGSAYRRPGARMLIPQLGGSVGTVSGGCLEGELIKKAWWLTEAGEPVIRTYSTGVADDEADEEEKLAFGLGCNGTVHILLERLNAERAPLPLMLLRQVQASGAPAVLATVIASCHEAVRLGERAGIDPEGSLHLDVSQVPLAQKLGIDRDHDLAALLADAAVAVMSHSYRQDRHWLEQALRLQPSYIGQLGPRSRTERLLDEIGPACRSLPAYARLHYPMGLDIGGDAPESVALSVLAEITAHCNGRDGGMLKARETPIHDSVPMLHG